jgi:hypothetical protein
MRGRQSIGVGRDAQDGNRSEFFPTPIESITSVDTIAYHDAGGERTEFLIENMLFSCHRKNSSKLNVISEKGLLTLCGSHNPWPFQISFSLSLCIPNASINVIGMRRRSWNVLDGWMNNARKDTSFKAD